MNLNSLAVLLQLALSLLSQVQSTPNISTSFREYAIGVANQTIQVALTETAKLQKNNSFSNTAVSVPSVYVNNYYITKQSDPVVVEEIKKSNVDLKVRYDDVAGFLWSDQRPFYINKSILSQSQGSGKLVFYIDFDPPLGYYNGADSIPASCFRSGDWSGDLSASTGYHFEEKIKPDDNMLTQTGREYRYQIDCTLLNGYKSSDYILIHPANSFDFSTDESTCSKNYEKTPCFYRVDS